MLWDLIRDFFVENVFGGVNSSGTLFNITLGRGWYVDGADDIIFGGDYMFQMSSGLNGDTSFRYISLADWLSTTATAISITIIVVLCCLFIYKIIRLVGGLIR